ncbi:cytochrome P450 [Nocardia sp. CA-290969]|uniref:cytochrome P450 n=1 Tax=Nocardia sp. CA-290969 TaxID=3239986 RepID=UPI003D8EAF0D
MLTGVTTIPAGAHVLPLVGSANRDPHRFADPGEFRLDRPDIQDHLAFGVGIHYCIGSARPDGSHSVVAEIARRVPALAPAGTPQRIASPVLHGQRSRPVALGIPAARHRDTGREQVRSRTTGPVLRRRRNDSGARFAAHHFGDPGGRER